MKLYSRKTIALSIALATLPFLSFSGDVKPQKRRESCCDNLGGIRIFAPGKASIAFGGAALVIGSGVLGGPLAAAAAIGGVIGGAGWLAAQENAGNND